MPQQFAVSDLFTEKEIARAVELYRVCEAGTFNRRVTEEIVRDAMPRINKTTGQENDAAFMAYALEHAIASSMSHRPR